MSVPRFDAVENPVVTDDAVHPAGPSRPGFIYWHPCLGMPPVRIDSPSQFIVPHLLVWAVSLIILAIFI